MGSSIDVLLLTIFVDDPLDLVGGHLWIDFAVDRHGGGEGAGPDAADCLDGEEAIFGGLSGLNPQLLMEFVEHQGRCR